MRNRAAESQVTIAHSAMEACLGADAICVLTEWEEFKELDWEKVRALLSLRADSDLVIRSTNR